MGRATFGCVAAVVWAVAGAAGAAEARLDYRAEQSVKDTKFYLDRAEGAAKELEEKAGAMKVGDAAIKLRDVQGLIGMKDAAARELGFAEARLKALPVEHSKVKPQADRVAPLKASLAASEEKLAAVKAGLDKVVAAGTGAGFKADFDRLKEITVMYANSRLLQTQPEVAGDVIKQMGAVRAERQLIAEKYADLLKQETPQANEMRGTLAQFDAKFGAFEAETKAFAQNGPGAVGDAVDELMRTAEQGAREKKPLFFGEHGGVNSELKRAETLYSVLAAVSPDAAETRAARAKLDGAKARIGEMRESLMGDIVANNAPPDETYEGADKEALIGLVKAKWAESGSKAEVLRVGINSTQWGRHTRWERNASGWYKVDASRAQGFVIVKLDEKLAAIYHVNLSKDHLAGDRITTYFFNDPKVAPEVGQKMLLKKVK